MAFLRISNHLGGIKPLINNLKPQFDNNPVPPQVPLNPPTYIHAKTLDTGSRLELVLQTFIHSVVSSPSTKSDSFSTFQ